MNGITILIWITIAIIAIIAIIIVKLHYRGEELANDEGSLLGNIEPMKKVVNAGQGILSKNSNSSKSNHKAQRNKYDSNNSESRITFNDADEPVVYEVENDISNENNESKITFNDVYDEPAVYEVENDISYKNIELKSHDQVYIDYGDTVEKFQEPIKQSQMDIMTQNNTPNNEKHELKDLFTIDELIKESKRKDSEREKEAHSAEEDKEITELKESIKKRQENENIEESLIEEIITEDEDSIAELVSETKTEIADAIEEEDAEAKTEITEAIEEEADKDTVEGEDVTTEEIETPIVTSQDIKEAIDTASQEVAEEPESISESSDITDALLKDTEEEEAPEDEIKEPILKTPTKVDESKKDIGSDNVVSEYENDLDYRKDLAKITNTIKGSKIFQDVRERLISEPEPIEDINNFEEDYIRNVNEYDEFEPIINETHSDFETYEEYHKADADARLREENSKKVFEIIKETPKKPVEPKIAPIKEKPSRDNIKIQINNNEVVLKKGDEIIFNHMGETYSSQVYAINGDDISVKYRRQNITIKPSDVKKVY